MSENKHEHGYVGDILKITVKTVRTQVTIWISQWMPRISFSSITLEVNILFSNIGLSPW